MDKKKKNNSIISMNGLTLAEIARFKRLSMLDGNLLSIFLSFFGGFMLTAYAISIGFSNVSTGWLYSLLLLSSSIGPFGAWLAEKLGARKFLTVRSALIGRSLCLLLPFVATIEVFAIKASLFVLILTIFSLLSAINTVLWCSWMASVVPDKERGSFLTKRFAINNLFGLGGMIVAGVLLDLIAKPFNFTIVAWVFTLFGLLAIIPLSKQPEARYQTIEKTSLKDTYSAALFNPKFKNLLQFARRFYFGYHIIFTFLFVYFIKDLNMSYTLISAWWCLNSLSILYFSTGWGRLADKHGTKPVLIVAIAISAVMLPVLLVSAGNGFMPGVWIAAIVEGLCAAATSSLMLNLSIKTATIKERSSIPAGFLAMTGLAGALANPIGGFLMDNLGFMRDLQLLNLTFVPFYVVLCLGSLVKVFSLIPLVKVFEENASTVKEILPDIIPMLFRLKRDDKIDKTGTDD